MRNVMMCLRKSLRAAPTKSDALNRPDDLGRARKREISGNSTLSTRS
jgi:hypothetical protein